MQQARCAIPIFKAKRELLGLNPVGPRPWPGPARKARRPDVFPPPRKTGGSKMHFFSAGRLRRAAQWSTKKHVFFSSQPWRGPVCSCWGWTAPRMLSNHCCHLDRTPAISQKRESKILKRKWRNGATTCETLCTNGFVIQRKNVNVLQTPT